MADFTSDLRNIDLDDDDDFEEETVENTEEESEDTVNTGEETKADKFKRLASARVNKLLHDIGNLGKLSSNAYEYTPEQVDAMFSALSEALEDARGKFEKKKEQKAFSF